MTESPKLQLLTGIDILRPVLGDGFTFEFRSEGRASSGDFAWGEFFAGGHRLELHFSRDLGPVLYHAGQAHVSHAFYMRELQIAARYPGFSDSAVRGFVALAQDLAQATDFLAGDGSVLRRAAQLEARHLEKKSSDLMVGYVGDHRAREKLSQAFSARRYEEVQQLASGLKYPEQLTAAELKMIAMARRRVNR